MVTKSFHKKYSLTAEWEYVIYMHINLKIIHTPNNFVWVTSSTPLTEGYMWSRLGLGRRRRNTFCCLGLINYHFIVICPLHDVPEFVSKLTSVFPGTSKLVSSAYFKSKLTADLGSIAVLCSVCYFFQFCLIVYSVSQKSSPPPKTFSNIFT